MVTLTAFPAVISGIKSENHGDGSEWTGTALNTMTLMFDCG
jgi:hypothetical protein